MDPKRVSWPALQVLQALTRLSDAGGVACPSRRALRLHARVDRWQLRAALRELEVGRLVVTEQRPGFYGVVYRVLTPEVDR